MGTTVPLGFRYPDGADPIVYPDPSLPGHYRNRVQDLAEDVDNAVAALLTSLDAARLSDAAMANGGPQMVTNGLEPVINLTSELLDTRGNMIDLAATTNGVTIRTAGTYLVAGYALWGTVSGGYRSASVYRTDTLAVDTRLAYARSMQPTVMTAGGWGAACGAIAQLAVGDLISVRAQHNAGTVFLTQIQCTYVHLAVMRIAP